MNWHFGPTVSLGRLSFAEHTELAARHNGAENWEYRRLTVYAVEANRLSKSRHSHNPSTELDWLNQQSLNVEAVSKDGTTEDVEHLSL